MKINIRYAGTLTTLQDLGRHQWRSAGVPVGGAADYYSHAAANFLAGNEAEAATLEYAGGLFEGQVETAGAIGFLGLGGELRLNGQTAPSGRLLPVGAGDLIQIRPTKVGCYAYLSTPGGWQVETVLGSRSTCLSGHFGGFEGRAFKAEDVISGASAPSESSNSQVWIPELRKKPLIRVFEGPELRKMGLGVDEWFLEGFQIGAARNRMGIRLKPLHQGNWQYEKPLDMVSTAVMPGVVQLPPDGCPIILMADAQTSGGYPRIAQVWFSDLPVLAQIPAGQAVQFEWTSLDAACQGYRTYFLRMQRLRAACRYQSLAGRNISAIIQRADPPP